MSEAPRFIIPDWPAPPGVHALVTTRAAGVEAAALPAGPRWLKQVHGITVADLDLLPAGVVPEADAAVATHPGTVCAVRTADCLPVLLAATDGSVVAAAHAGWRGLAAGVLEATVAALRSRSRSPLIAWLGPAIGPANFEVGGEVREAFLAHDAAAAAAFARGRGDRWLADLYLLARLRLRASGVGQTGGGGFCTYADGVRFHSHRRDVTHGGLDATGRMAALVWRQV